MAYYQSSKPAKSIPHVKSMTWSFQFIFRARWPAAGVLWLFLTNQNSEFMNTL